MGVINGSSSSSSSASSPPKRKWKNFVVAFVAFVVIGEMAFLGRLDLAKNAAIVDWAHARFYRSGKSVDSGYEDEKELAVAGVKECEEWLEKEDAVVYVRDFDKDPVLIVGAEKETMTCPVGCHFGYEPGKNADAVFGTPGHGSFSVLRSMESAEYYKENDIAEARRRGYDVIMTTSLSSDVPVGYFSWAEYDIMVPVQPKTEKSLAAAFISNCGARNFRLEALEALENANVSIDSYGNCHRNRDGRVDKVETLKRYKFSLAFENSNEEDYVTEKFFQSLVAGSIPVVVGAPNIQDFAPAPGSVLHIKHLEDVETIARTMKHLAENPDAYNHLLQWKYDGPSDSFKALIDMAAVHSSCRLCIHLATVIREKEEHSPELKIRPCRCNRGPWTVYHMYVRERGRFEMEPIFLRSGDLTLKSLESEVLKKFMSKNHMPIWKKERPESIRGGNYYKVHLIYPVGLTQRQALYTFRFKGDEDFQSYLESHPCAKFEVIFV